MIAPNGTATRAQRCSGTAAQTATGPAFAAAALPMPANSPWSDREIDLIVEDYFEMLTLELSGRSYVKARYRSRLQEITGRSSGSIEFKHCNITAVLDFLGLPTINGYKRRDNFQASLIDGVGRYLAEHHELLPMQRAVQRHALSEENELFIEPAPAISIDDTPSVELKRLFRRFDPAIRDARNRELGRKGEEFAFLSERRRLKLEGRNDLVRRVRWVAQEDGDGAGFDVLSFEASGKERLIEVKTTTGGARTPFLLSENERSVSVERSDAYCLLRLFDFCRKPRAFELFPPLCAHVHLAPVEYRATFQADRSFATELQAISS